MVRGFFDSWLERFSTWDDFVKGVENNTLPEFGQSAQSAVKQVTDWLGGAAEALSDYDMLCCMIDENLTQQHIEPKTVFEIVAAGINEAEKMLRASRNVHEFNAYFKRSRGLPTLLQENKSHRPMSDDGIGWREEEYTKAKLAIEPSGDGLGKDFLRRFLPSNSVPSNSTLQTTITGIYEERWREEGDRLTEESQRLLWQGKEANDQELIAAALELEKQARVLPAPHDPAMQVNAGRASQSQVHPDAHGTAVFWL